MPIDAAPALTQAFDRSDVTPLRHAVAAYASEAGLTGEPLDDFALAVNELITNAVRHGGGRGWLRLWQSGGAVVCEVSDSGTGIDRDRLANDEPPAPDTPGGWGLWLADQLTDSMVIRTGAAGTTVRISSMVQPQHAPEPME